VREGHPARQFGTGNRATLAGTTREELLAWYQAHYSANRMMLALTGAASLDQLERWARQYFEAVPDRQLPALRYPADYMPPRAALRELRMEPIKDLRHLTLSFPLPDLRAHVLSKPAEQLAFVLGHEGRGSLLSALKAEGLATGLGVWAEPETPDYGSFDMQISLTPDGLAKSARVLELVFATIERIRREGLPPHLFQERQAMARLDERYRDKGEGMGRAANLANALMDYPIDIAERVPFLWVQPDSKAVAAVLAHLRPDNLLVMRVAKGVPTDRVAPHYGTRYSLSEDGGAAYAALLKPAATAAITPPAPNPFIAERTALLALQPVRLIDEPALSLYHLQDTEFQRPLVAHLLRWRLPRDRASLQTAVLMRFYEAAVREALTETTYTAAEAGLQFGLSAGLDGVQLVVEGYDASVGRLLDAVAPALVDLRLSEARFGALKERLLRELAAFELGDAYETLRESRLRTAREFHWRPDEQLPLARTVTLAQVQAFARSLYARGRLEALSHGNIAAPEAAAAVRRVAALLKTKPVAPTRLLKRRLLAGTPGEALRASETLKVNNSAYRAEYLIGRDSPELRAATAVLAAFIAEPFYTELRTKQQLGYIVAGGAAEDSGRLLATFLVQSADHPADEVERRVRALIAGLPRQLAELDEAGWKTLVDGVRARPGRRTARRPPDRRRRPNPDRAQHDQRVGLAHAAQHARALRAGEAHLPAPSGRAADDAALELGAAGALAHRARAACLQHRQRLGGGAGQLQQGLAREGVEGHECGHRVAGQREQPALAAAAVDRRAFSGAEGKRPTRAHGHLPEGHLAHARQHVARVVGVAHADAAAGQHHVGLRASAACSVACSAAGSSRTRPRSMTSMPSRCSAPSRLSGCCRRCSPGPAAAQASAFVAGGKQRHAQAAHAPSCPMPSEATSPGRPGAAHARRAARATARQVFALHAAVFAGLQDARLDVHLRPSARGTVPAAPRCPARRHHGAGHDAHAVARGRRCRRTARRRTPCPRLQQRGVASARSAAPAKA
jgi:insulysin